MSRKRAAPGVEPTIPQQSPMQGLMDYDTANLGNDQLFNWSDPNVMNNMSTAFPDNSTCDPNLYTTFNGSAQQQNAQGGNTNQTSNQLVRRNTNHQLAARNGQQVQDPWEQDFAMTAGQGQQPGWENADDDEEELEQKALIAKREAQAKRKQIPPFVQKLSSFLDESRNTDLIRWSDDGRSFIVIDEDEFAKTLIPELFKHNNYASFVRQLNMYGFHKKVGLSDNSMRASEKKAKTPSEYYNKYFRRGKPDLLWLIQKPKNPPGGAKRKRDDDKKGIADGEDDAQDIGLDVLDGQPRLPQGTTAPANRDFTMIPKSELSNFRNELQMLQQQQRVISSAINQLRQQNQQFYQQASAFQNLHDRHENSINAILTFLATFYNRSLEGQHGPNMQDLFNHAIGTNNQNLGNIVDMGDVKETDINTSSQPRRTPRKPLALLPAPAASNQGGRATTMPPSARGSPMPFKQQQQGGSHLQPRTGRIETTSPDSTGRPSVSPIVKDDAPTPNLVNDVPEQGTSNNDIMSVIQNANASSNANTPSGPSFDLPAALSHYETAGGNAPLTPQQRTDMLNLINASATNGGSNNALAAPTPPPMPSLEQFTATQDQLDFLERLQKEQDQKIQQMSNRIEPLSPTGSIPGLSNGNYFNSDGTDANQVTDADFDTFLNSDPYSYDPAPLNGDPSQWATSTEGDPSFGNLDNDFPASGELSHGGDGGLFDPVDFGAEGTADSAVAGLQANNEGDVGGRVESLSSEATSPAATVGDDERRKSTEETRSPNKRQRKS